MLNHSFSPLSNIKGCPEGFLANINTLSLSEEGRNQSRFHLTVQQSNHHKNTTVSVVVQ